MAKVRDIDTSIKATIISDKCHIPCACVDDKDTSIKGTIIEPTVKATTTKYGVVRLATEQEAKDGIKEDSVVITPYTLKKATTYTHEQAIASDEWVIEHNLNRTPSITVVDSANNVIECAEQYIDMNTVKLYFNGSFKGKAYLN